MPSNLRLQLDSQSTQSYYASPFAQSSPAKKQKMSLTQTYRIASTARGKLGQEAARSDHDLRLLVGHANLLDSLMLELANAEREQEAWFNDNLRSASKPEGPKHVQWMDTLAEEEDSSDSDSDSDSDLDINDFPEATVTRRRSVSPPPARVVYADDDELDWEDLEDEERDEEHALIRVSSHIEMPDLIEESDSEDDESMPPSPGQSSLDSLDYERQRRTIEAVELFQKLPARLAQPAVLEANNAPMISAY